ncbi:MAG: type IV pilus assembly protein PilM [Phycisphaeraceae bacterium]|nr:type IV pilus assembly protein PilM [Phycisphaeraceae bacterium]
MPSSKAAWGIEVGAGAVKAIRLERSGSEVQVTDFAYIEHKKVLTTPDLDHNEVIRLSLGQLVSQKNFENERVVMSVPGHSALARFAKLPPVEPKKIPDIVKFEAVQQIPFPIDQVEWDYQTFSAPDSPEVEVGIFAITKEKIADRLALYGELGLTPEIVTLSPLAVYNAAVHDLETKPGTPLVILDIGTSASDLIVALDGHCWIRTFPLGGHHFTEALEQSFSLSYSKAERLKHESATSQYAKQMMQAMRPVIGDLLQEVQRSLGHFQTLHREAQVSSIIGVGSTFKIPGLRKFLGQQLQLEVNRLDEFKKIRVEGREAADFAAHCVNFATAYGLALQGVGQSAIAVNLSPVRNIREKVWASKTKWFGAAAAIAIVAGAAMTVRPLIERVQIPGDMPQVTRVKNSGKGFVDEYRRVESSSDIGFVAENMRRLLEDREVWPFLVRDSFEALRSSKPSRVELEATNIADVLRLSAGQRNLIMLERLSGTYDFVNGRRVIDVRMQVTFPERDQPRGFLNSTVGDWLRANADRPDVPYIILSDTTSPSIEVTGPLGGPESERAPGQRGSDDSLDLPSMPGREGDAGATTPSAPPSQGHPGRQRPGAGGGVSRGGDGGGGGVGFGIGELKPPPGTDREPVEEERRQGPTGPSPEEVAEAKELDQLAPIPGLPGIYSNVRFHRAVITFRVQLRGDAGPAPATEEGVQ